MVQQAFGHSFLVRQVQSKHIDAQSRQGLSLFLGSDYNTYVLLLDYVVRQKVCNDGTSAVQKSVDDINPIVDPTCSQRRP